MKSNYSTIYFCQDVVTGIEFKQKTNIEAQLIDSHPTQKELSSYFKPQKFNSE